MLVGLVATVRGERTVTPEHLFPAERGFGFRCGDTRRRIRLSLLMDTTVTGMFPSHRAAGLAAARLVAAGFRSDQIRVVDADSRDRHRMIDETTSGAARGVMLGGLFGAIGGSLAGVLMESLLGMGHATLVGALVGTFGGAVLGLVVGRSTKSQVRDELEHQVEAGAVLVNVVTEDARTGIALHLLAEEGGTSVVSTAASFTAAGVPNTPEA